MTLTAFSVDNYRSFFDPVEIELRPLTLLFGYNSVGKSALMRTLPLIAASVDPMNAAPLALRSMAARGATFSDLRCQCGSKPDIHFGLRWEGERLGSSSINFVIRNEMLRSAQDQRLSEQMILYLLGFSTPNSYSMLAGWSPAESDISTLNRYHIEYSPEGATPWEQATANLELEGLFPVSLEGDALPNWMPTVLAECQRLLRSLRTQVHWLGAVRTLPQRRCPYGPPPRRLQPDGEGAADVLAADDQGDRSLVAQVSSFYERATHHRLEVRRQGDLFSIVLSPLGTTPFQVNILDTGEGMAQVLPVLVLGAMAAKNRLGQSPIIGIEQPELHLHAAAQAELASYFCEITRQPSRPRLLIETHSENFLLRVQLEILRGMLKPEDVLVYWIRQLEDGRSVADPIPFDELARPRGRGWPTGVFSEDVEQARQIALERRKRISQ
ncbi:MAG: AAA family ATPase [Polyangia bacterium]